MPQERRGGPLLFEEILMNIMPSAYHGLMLKYWQYTRTHGATDAPTPEEFYGFTSTEVRVTHHHKQGKGPGLWFRLRDGRVYDKSSHSDEVDPVLYDATTH
jgi:hypothetical protein